MFKFVCSTHQVCNHPSKGDWSKSDPNLYGSTTNSKLPIYIYALKLQKVYEQYPIGVWV